MPETFRCPDCGAANPAGASVCANCNHPLNEDHHLPAGGAAREGSPPAAAVPSGPDAPAAPAGAPVVIRRTIRPRRPRPAASSQAAQLWLVFGTISALFVLWVGFQSARERSKPQVTGANAEQQKVADALFAEFERDSNNVEVRQRLGDVMYDTGNWSDAIVHYRAAIGRDSSRVHALVDLGVCYFNLGDPGHAQELFELALVREPQQPVALFNLGIVHEGREENDAALQFYHRAMESNPPESMKQPLMERMDALFKKTGKKAPPLPGGK